MDFDVAQGPTKMKILIASLLSVTLATFVPLNTTRSSITLRHHYRSILRYATLNHFEKGVEAQISVSTSQPDALGQLAKLLQSEYAQARASHRQQAAWASLYASVWAVRKGVPGMRGFRARLEDIWTDCFRALLPLCGQDRACREKIAAFLHAKQEGKACVACRSFGKRSLARAIIDDPSAVFLSDPRLRVVLRDLEVKTVRALSDFCPLRLQHRLAAPLSKLAEAFEKALTVKVNEQLGTAAVAGCGCKNETMIDLMPGPQSNWKQWASKARRFVRAREQRCVDKCHRHAEKRIKQIEKMAESKAGDDLSNESEQEWKNKLPDWIARVKQHLSTFEKQQQQQPQGTIFEEEQHIVEH